ncbi:MAG: hypothetical protein L3K15_01520 [Thermoplasmata archaeon]|nr:hypothetical protein [Thermoplasmata archaeon]
MNRAAFLFLVAAALLVAFLALEPLLSFALFGSDTGEYYRLTSSLLTTGGIPRGSSYLGWGFAYPDFPGIFLLAGAAAGATGTDVLASITIVIPVVAVLSILPLFLLFRRLVDHDGVAVLGAALATIAMPRLFSIAHPAPLALGDFLVIAALWMFVEGRRDRRWYLPLALTTLALIPTHHLSSYFFLLSALGGLVLLELFRPGAWSRRFPARELAFLGGFSALLLAYWFAYARSFASVVRQGIPGSASGALLPVALAALVGVLIVGSGVVVRWRRGRPRRRPATLKTPSDRSLLRDAAIILGATFVGIALLLLRPIPGSGQTTTLASIVFFAPLLVTIGAASGSRRLVAFSRLGPFALAWTLALGLSALLALATANPVVLPERHPEYMLIPVMLLVAVSLGRLVARSASGRSRATIVAGGVALLVVVAANAAIVYPPQADLGGFQEGLTPADAGLWMWVGIALPPSAVVASDHRLSSMIFGFDGNRATWDSTPALFVGDNATLAFRELRGTFAPHADPPYYSLLPVWAVAVDATMYGGVALNPGAIAVPFSVAAQHWLAAPPFIPLYENGAQVVYWVDAGSLPP